MYILANLTATSLDTTKDDKIVSKSSKDSNAVSTGTSCFWLPGSGSSRSIYILRHILEDSVEMVQKIIGIL